MIYRGPTGEVEAWQWNFSVDQEPDPDWVRDALIKLPSQFGNINSDFMNTSEGPVIWTLNLKGVSCAYPGDYLVRGYFGDVYMWTKEEFELEFPIKR
jgi:hypothetical protein